MNKKGKKCKFAIGGYYNENLINSDLNNSLLENLLPALGVGLANSSKLNSSNDSEFLAGVTNTGMAGLNGLLDYVNENSKNKNIKELNRTANQNKYIQNTYTPFYENTQSYTQYMADGGKTKPIQKVYNTKPHGLSYDEWLEDTFNKNGRKPIDTDNKLVTEMYKKGYTFDQLPLIKLQSDTLKIPIIDLNKKYEDGGSTEQSIFDLIGMQDPFLNLGNDQKTNNVVTNNVVTNQQNPNQISFTPSPYVAEQDNTAVYAQQQLRNSEKPNKKEDLNEVVTNPLIAKYLSHQQGKEGLRQILQAVQTGDEKYISPTVYKHVIDNISDKKLIKDSKLDTIKNFLSEWNNKLGQPVNLTNVDKKVVDSITKAAQEAGENPAEWLKIAEVESGLGKNLHRKGSDYHGYFQIDKHYVKNQNDLYDPYLATKAAIALHKAGSVRKGQYLKYEDGGRFEDIFKSKDGKIEAEGKESLKLDNGLNMSLSGPSHENGGIPLEVNNGFIYSEKLKLDKKAAEAYAAYVLNLKSTDKEDLEKSDYKKLQSKTKDFKGKSFSDINKQFNNTEREFEIIKDKKEDTFKVKSASLNVQNKNQSSDFLAMLQERYKDELGKENNLKELAQPMMRYGGNIKKYASGGMTGEPPFPEGSEESKQLLKEYLSQLKQLGIGDFKSIGEVHQYLVKNHPELVKDYMNVEKPTNLYNSNKTDDFRGFNDNLWWYRGLVPKSQSFENKQLFDEFIKGKTKVTENGKDYYYDPNDKSNIKQYINPSYKQGMNFPKEIFDPNETTIDNQNNPKYYQEQVTRDNYDNWKKDREQLVIPNGPKGSDNYFETTYFKDPQGNFAQPYLIDKDPNKVTLQPNLDFSIPGTGSKSTVIPPNPTQPTQPNNPNLPSYNKNFSYDPVIEANNLRLFNNLVANRNEIHYPHLKETSPVNELLKPLDLPKMLNNNQNQQIQEYQGQINNSNLDNITKQAFLNNSLNEVFKANNQNIEQIGKYYNDTTNQNIGINNQNNQNQYTSRINNMEEYRKELDNVNMGKYDSRKDNLNALTNYAVNNTLIPYNLNQAFLDKNIDYKMNPNTNSIDYSFNTTNNELLNLFYAAKSKGLIK